MVPGAAALVAMRRLMPVRARRCRRQPCLHRSACDEDHCRCEEIAARRSLRALGRCQSLASGDAGACTSACGAPRVSAAAAGSAERLSSLVMAWRWLAVGPPLALALAIRAPLPTNCTHATPAAPRHRSASRAGTSGAPPPSMLWSSPRPSAPWVRQGGKCPCRTPMQHTEHRATRRTAAHGGHAALMHSTTLTPEPARPGCGAHFCCRALLRPPKCPAPPARASHLPRPRAS